MGEKLVIAEFESYKNRLGEVVRISRKTGLVVPLFIDSNNKTYRQDGVCISHPSKYLNLVSHVPAKIQGEMTIRPFVKWGFDIEITPFDKFKVVAGLGLVYIEIEKDLGETITLRRMITEHDGSVVTKPFDVKMLSREERNDIIVKLMQDNYRQEDVVRLLGLNQSTVSLALSSVNYQK